MGETAGAPDAGVYVSYDPGPDRQVLGARHGIEIQQGQVRTLKRLEADFGTERVSRWADEGMPVRTMGKPRDMKAFRNRQEERPDEIPTDVERRNEASLERNAAPNRDDGPAGETGVPDAVRDVVSSPGRSMDETVQREMETKVGGDFADVRIHTGPKAAAAAESINARAFTVGNHVAFNKGEYQPESTDGKEVLAHELTHVRQQTNGAVSLLPKGATLAIDPDPALEREAEETAREVTMERRPGTEVYVQPIPGEVSPGGGAGSQVERAALDSSRRSAESRSPRAIQRQAATTNGGGAGTETAQEGGNEAAAEGDGGRSGGETYTVREGDNLSAIAEAHDVPGGWQSLWEENRTVVGDNPDHILPGHELDIPAGIGGTDGAKEGPKEPAGGFTPAPPLGKPDAEGAPEPGPDETKPAEGPADPEAEGKPASEPQTPGPSSPDMSAEAGGRTTGEEPATDTGPEETAPASPQEDPAFQAVVEQTEAAAEKKAAHPPAEKAAASAQAAAEGPPNERESKAAANQVEEMAKQEPEPFDRAAFKEALMAKIEETAPSTLEEADEFEKENELGTVKNELNSEVSEGKKQAQAPIEKKAEESPDTSSVEPKQSSPMETPDPGARPRVEKAAGAAAPKPKSDAEVEQPFEEQSQSLDQQMGAEGITEEQLAKSNEPEFESALESKRKAQSHAAESPSKFREAEREVVSQAETEAKSMTADRMQSMDAVAQAQTDRVGSAQEQAKTEDEKRRAEVASHIQSIYEDAEQRVQERLDRLDEEVDSTFEEGADEARADFESYVDRRMSKYKEERYGGPGGGLRWGKDKLLGMPDEVNRFYEKGRDRYVERMNGVLDRVVDTVAEGLTEAKQIIADGRQKVREYVEGLPESLAAVGKQAAANIQSKFDDLARNVNEKKDQLVDSLANKYNERLEQVDSRIEELKAQNEGLVDSAMNAIGGVVSTINNLKNMLLGVLAKATAAISSIINDPIGFLDNLVTGVQGGLEQFLSNIGTHLQQGLIGWLTGAVVPGGLELPEQLDLKGIFSIVTQILGLTYENIKERAEGIFGQEVVGYLEAAFEFFSSIASKGVPDLSNFGEILGLIYEGVKERAEDALGSKTVQRLEATYEIVRSVISEGISALLNVEEILQMLDLKEMILGKIKDVVRNEVIEAGIQWIIGLLSPASAFIKACKMIYDVINFFVTRGKQIMSMVNSVLDSVLAIAKGKTGGVASKVSEALGAQVPVLISFLASLLGLTGIANRVNGIIESAKGTVDKVIEWVLEKVKGVFTSIGEALSGLVSGSDEETEESAAAGGGRAASSTEEGSAVVAGSAEDTESAFDNSFTPTLVHQLQNNPNRSVRSVLEGLADTTTPLKAGQLQPGAGGATTNAQGLHHPTIAQYGNSVNMSKKRRQIAVMVANENYNIINSLATPIRETNTLSSTLQSRGYQTNIHTDQTSSEMEPIYNSALNQVGTDDTLVAYYAGHGMPDGLVGINHGPNNRDIYENNKVSDVVSSATSQGAHIRFIMDSCHSGSAAQLVREERKTDLEREEREERGDSSLDEVRLLALEGITQERSRLVKHVRERESNLNRITKAIQEHKNQRPTDMSGMNGQIWQRVLNGLQQTRILMKQAYDRVADRIWDSLRPNLAVVAWAVDGPAPPESISDYATLGAQLNSMDVIYEKVAESIEQKKGR